MTINAEPRIAISEEKKLVGKRLKMSLSNNRTMALWQSFMPLRKQVSNNVSTDLYSMQVYDESFDYKDFNVNAEFEKWAAIEVTDFTQVPDDLEKYTLRGGLYAVFTHIGGPATGHTTFKYIFTKWLPMSEYELDKREHFEILGDKYKNNDPNSEEEIWIPIRNKD